MLDDGGLFHEALKGLLLRLHAAVATAIDDTVHQEIPVPTVMLTDFHEEDGEEVGTGFITVRVTDAGAENQAIALFSSAQLARDFRDRHNISAKLITSKPEVLVAEFFGDEQFEETDDMTVVIDPVGTAAVEFLQSATFDEYLAALMTWVNLKIDDAPPLRTTTVSACWGKNSENLN